MADTFYDINSVIATKNQKVFSINTAGTGNQTKMFIADTDQLTAFDRNNIDCSLGFSVPNGSLAPTLFHNMYDAHDVYFKSAIYGVSKTTRTGTSKDFQNITSRPYSNLCCGTQIGNTLYLLEANSNLGRMNFDIYQELSVDDSRQLSDVLVILPIETVIYNRDNIQAELSTQINPENAVKETLTNINYNILFEVPGSVKNDYQSGNIAANSFKAKNQYDSTYSMAHSAGQKLENCREYVAVDRCSEQVYLKYYDRVNYASSSSTAVISSKQKNGFTFQHIETINNINRFANLNGHKSNLYSISVKTDIIDNIKQTTTRKKLDQLKLNIANEIKNVVRDITKKLAPAQTQLFDVYVNGN